MPVYNSWNNKIQLAQLSCNTWKVPIWPSPWIELYKLYSSLIFRQSSLIWPNCFSFTDQLTQQKEKEFYRKKKFGGCSYWYFRRQITGVSSYLIIFKKPSRFHFKCLTSWYWYKCLAILHFFSQNDSICWIRYRYEGYGLSRKVFIFPDQNSTFQMI